MDLFEQRAPVNLDGNYGSAGDMKKTQYMLQLLGTPWDPDTLKCIITAAEQGMEMTTGFLDTIKGEQDSQEYRSTFEFGTYPGLKEADYHVAGASAIMAFINARGLGYSLVPKNVNEAAKQDFWVDIAITEATPYVNMLVQEKIVQPMVDSSYKIDHDVCNHAKENLGKILDVLDEQLKGNTYIIGKYSFADVHWTALVHLLMLVDEPNLVSSRAQVQRWYESLATRKTNCGQDLVSFSLLPSRESIQRRELSSVVIEDF